MARRKPKISMPGILKPKRARRRRTKLPQSIYGKNGLYWQEKPSRLKPSRLKDWPDARAGVSKTEQNFEYEQAQSLRWLRQYARGSQSIAQDTQDELQEFFRCSPIEQMKVGTQLTDESEAILKILAAERERSRIVQGGVANPNDWFLTATEENMLASLMSKATLNETGDAVPGKPERSKVEQAVVDFEEQEARDISAKAIRRLAEQLRNNPPKDRGQARQRRRMRMAEKRSQAEQRRKEKETYQGHHQTEPDRAGGPSAYEPASRNAQHLVGQRWLGGNDPHQIGPPRRSERLRQQEDMEQAGGLEIVQAAQMMERLDIRMEV